MHGVAKRISQWVKATVWVREHEIPPLVVDKQDYVVVVCSCEGGAIADLAAPRRGHSADGGAELGVATDIAFGLLCPRADFTDRKTCELLKYCCCSPRCACMVRVRRPGCGMRLPSCREEELLNG